MEYDLRAARSTDAGQTGAILSAFIDETDWMPRIHTRAEDLSFAADLIDRGWVTVAETTGTIAGFCACDGKMIHALYVTRGFQGQGCGAALLSFEKSRHAALTLWTFQANQDAQRFYLAHGFAEVERTDGAGNDEGLPDLRYEWKGEAT